MEWETTVLIRDPADRQVLAVVVCAEVIVCSVIDCGKEPGHEPSHEWESLIEIYGYIRVSSIYT